MSYYNLLRRNLKFFNYNLHNNSDTDTSEISTTSINGGVRKNKKKFNVIDFNFDDLVDADSEVFTNSKSINPFLRTATDEPIQTESALKDEIINENPDIDETNPNQTDLNNPEIYDENEEGRPINNEENKEDEILLTNENMLFEEAVEAEEEDAEADQDDSSDNEDNSSDSSDDEHIKKYFSNYSLKGGKNISNIKDELSNDKDIEEYTKNIKKSSSLTGGNIKPIKRGTNKLYPYNLY